jgi:hypothetical protein
MMTSCRTSTPNSLPSNPLNLSPTDFQNYIRNPNALNTHDAASFNDYKTGYTVWFNGNDGQESTVALHFQETYNLADGP